MVSSDRYLFQINSFFANYVIKSDICSNCMKFSMDDLKKEKEKRMTLNIFQITPSRLTLIVTTERMTNHYSQWVPSSLMKE